MKNAVKLLSILLLASGVMFVSCNKDKQVVKKEIFSGYAQKGPFAVGSSVTIVELDEKLDQTGKTYFTTISDNLGSFEQKNIELVSSYVELKVEGYYFHEIGGGITSSPVTLYALVDISDVNSANVNVLTHLEKPRVEYLVKQGMSFAEAKQQAQKEVLAIFGFNSPQTSSEELNLTDNAMLIAISCILQSYLLTSGMTELMISISIDIKPDGILNNMDLKTKLIKNANILIDNTFSTISLSQIRHNLETKYPNVTIPDFESYVQAFIDANK